MLSILTKNKIIVVNSTTLITHDGEATTIIIDGKRYIVHGKNVVSQIKEAIRRGDNYVEVE